MEVFGSESFDDHEEVTFVGDNHLGLKAVIAIHNTALGPALGGLRIWPYASEQHALEDVLRLSKGMTYKNAVAGIPFGGGKMVVILDPKKPKPDGLMERLGTAIEHKAGRYITGEDVGSTFEDMVQRKRFADPLLPC